MLFGGGRPEDENLDSPMSNFDVIGVPTGRWSSHFFGCFENIMPSCILSFFCPCIMWAQIVVRAQIPLLISIKNAFSCLRGRSGYGAFIDYFMWSLIICAILIVVLVTVTLNTQLAYFLGAVVVILGGPFLYAIGHTRTAFKMKYTIASCFPPGWHFWEMLWDVVVSITCMPCSLAQMARHVFQYDKMDTKLGLFVSDPSTLPPLRPTDVETGNGGAPYERPARADTAGLTWTYDGRHPEAKDNTGAAHRQQEIYERQQAQMRAEHAARGATAPPTAATATATANPVRGGNVVYNADGSVARR